MEIFWLKYRDTRPVLEVVLHDPSPTCNPEELGPVHDLTGPSVEVHLHILLSSGAVVTRDMEIVEPASNGTVRYIWTEADWDELIASPDWSKSSAKQHRMEYEVTGPNTARMTFPNNGNNPDNCYDILRIPSDLA